MSFDFGMKGIEKEKGDTEMLIRKTNRIELVTWNVLYFFILWLYHKVGKLIFG